MAAKITYQIGQQNFELIRDNIGQILADELANQTYANNLGVKVWNERFIQFDTTELPAINVAYSDTSYEDYSPTAQQGLNTYHIDIHASASHSDSEKGDEAASVKVKRLAGIVRYILMSMENRFLGFSPGVIQTRRVDTIEIGKIADQDTAHTVVIRVVFRVRANETIQKVDPTTQNFTFVEVKLNETDKGYLYETDQS
jgi:hypothetical protein